MIMTIENLNKVNMNIILQKYIDERESFKKLYSFDEYINDFVRICENCGDIVIVNDGDMELPLCTNFKGEKFRCCDRCYKDSIEYENSKIDDGEIELL